MLGVNARTSGIEFQVLDTSGSESPQYARTDWLVVVDSSRDVVVSCCLLAGLKVMLQCSFSGSLI